jgi:hypothetical protein
MIRVRRVPVTCGYVEAVPNWMEMGNGIEEGSNAYEKEE